MATVLTTAPSASTSPITLEERAHAEQQFRAALRESESLNDQLRELAARLREERDHVGE